MLDDGQRHVNLGLIAFPVPLLLLAIAPGSAPSASAQVAGAAVASEPPLDQATMVARLPAADAGRQVRRRTPDRQPFLTRPTARMSFGRLPLHFEENQGLTDERVKYLARGRGYTLFLTPTEAVLALRNGAMQASGKEREAHGTRESLSPDAGGEGQGEGESEGRDATMQPASSVLHMRLEGANPNPQVTAGEKLPGIVNYFIGNDPEKWCTKIPTYKKVTFEEVYSGIDLAYYSNQGKLEYDLIVSPGGDLSRIKRAFDGTEAQRAHPPQQADRV